MIEFNADGSIRLPQNYQQQQDNNRDRLKNQRCIQVIRQIISSRPPKKCILQITLSDIITDTRFISNIYEEFKKNAHTPTKLIKLNDKEFKIEIGTDFKRCTDCSRLVGEYREFLNGNLIEKKGECTFEGFKKNFCYEDYFD